MGPEQEPGVSFLTCFHSLGPTTSLSEKIWLGLSTSWSLVFSFRGDPPPWHRTSRFRSPPVAGAAGSAGG